MPFSHKKVIVRRFSAERVRGYLPAAGFVVEGAVDLLGLDGRRTPIALDQVHSISFVREFALGDSGASRRVFGGRPRGEGLWVRLIFRQDREELEGLASAELAMLDDLLRDRGVYLTPPDTRGNTQRLFVPRLAIAELSMLGVIRAASRRRDTSAIRTGVVDALLQEELFDVAAGPRRESRKEEGDHGDE